MSPIRKVEISNPDLLSHFASKINSFENAYKGQISLIHTLLLQKMSKIVNLKSRIDARVKEIQEELYYAELRLKNCQEDARGAEEDGSGFFINACSCEKDEVYRLKILYQKAKIAQDKTSGLVGNAQTSFSYMQNELQSLPNYIDPLCCDGVRTLKQLQQLLEEYLKK